MTERDGDAGRDRSGDDELRPPDEEAGAARRALADAVRDALLARAQTPEPDGPPMRAPTRPTFPSRPASEPSPDPAPVPVPAADPAGESEPDSAAETAPAVSEVAAAPPPIATPAPERKPSPDIEAAANMAPGSDIERGPGPVVGATDSESSESAGPAAAVGAASANVGAASAALAADVDSARADPASADPASAASGSGFASADADADAGSASDPADLDSDSAEPTGAVTAATAAAPEEPSSLEAPVAIDQQQHGRTRTSAKGVVAIGARALTGVIGVLVATLAIVGATVVPGPEVRTTPPAATVEPVPAAQQRVCPGPLLRLGDDAGQAASTATSVGRAGSVFQATPVEPDAAALAQTENTADVAPQVLTLPPQSGSAAAAPAVAGSQSQTVASGDLVGLASAECAEPGGDIWLVGGSTDVGRTTLVTLSNPTTVTATVDIVIFGPTGEVPAPGSRGIVVQPGSQRIFSLAGFAPQLVAPVVHVTSRGGLISAHLQQTTVRTLEPGGVDIVGGSAGPSRRAVVPGVVVGSAAAITEAQGRVGYEDLQTVLRVLVPGTAPSRVTITITADGATAAEADDSVAVEGGDAGTGGFEVTFAPGVVTEVPVPGLADGSYTVSIEGDEPLVAGVRTSVFDADSGSDFTWLPAGRPLRDTALLSVAFGPEPTLHLVNPGDEDRAVTIGVTEEDGAEDGSADATEVEVAAGESVDVPLVAGADVTLDGASGLLATVTYLSARQLAAFGVTAPGPASTPLTVYR